MTTKRYLFDIEGYDLDAVQDAIALAMRLASEDSSVQLVALLIPGLGILQDGALPDALGRDLAQRLLRDRRIKLTSGAVLEVQTPQTWSRSSYPQGVVAAFPDPKMLDLVDSVPGLRFAIVIPCAGVHVEQWKKAWAPTIPGQEQVAADSPLLRSKVLEEGLKMLTRNTNISTALSHPSDKASAKWLLWQLHKAGEWDNPDNIRAWALRNKWPPRGATRLMEEAQKAQTRRQAPPRAALRADIIQYLRAKVRGEPPEQTW